jgi:hypothetical protein
MSAALESAEIRNEFAAVRLTVRPHGRGTRLEVSSPQLGTTAMLDATVLEALTRSPRRSWPSSWEWRCRPPTRPSTATCRRRRRRRERRRGRRR